MKKYCCKQFKFDVEIDKTIFDYEQKIGQCNLEHYNIYQPLYYCFYCGEKFPTYVGKDNSSKLNDSRKNIIINLLDKYCCINMEGNVEEEPFSIAYEEYSREYFLIFYKSKCQKYRKIYYCGFCGKKLPKNLKKEWKFLLTKEFGIKDIVKEWGKIPEEFKTDKWWRKRDMKKISKELEATANNLDKKDIYFPIYRIEIDTLLSTDRKLATDISNSLIEEEFSAQDIVDIIQHFNIFVNMVMDEIPHTPNKSFLNNNYISRYLYCKIDDVYLEMEPEEYKETIKALVEKHRKDIKDLAKKLLEKIKKDDEEFIKDLEKKGFNKLVIEREKLRKERLKKERLKKKEYYWGRIVTSDVIASYFNKDIRIGENKIRMILDGRIRSSIDDPRYQFIPSKKEEVLKMSDFKVIKDSDS